MGFNDERKRMNEGELYRSNDAEILKEQLQCVEKLYDIMEQDLQKNKNVRDC